VIRLEEAWRLLDEAVRPLAIEDRPLIESLGSYLAESVHCDRDYPPSDRSAMDGFAVRAADTSGASVTLNVQGEVAAGADPVGVEVQPGHACRIFTGASMPRGADAVVMVEDTVEDRDAGTVVINREARVGQHVRHRASDRTEGELVLDAGIPIRPAEIAALATVGRDPVRVIRRPSTAILSTGDEIVPVTSSPQSYQVRNSNALMLQAQVAACGFTAEPLGVVADDAGSLRQAIHEGLQRDLLLLSGGVSVGEYDLVAEALADCGVETLFHGIRMKPGKPILAGRRQHEGRAQIVLALPGNPLSAYVGFRLFGEPVLRRLAGEATFEAQCRDTPLATAFKAKAGRTTFHLARRRETAAGRVVEPVASTGSGDVLALSRANGCIRTPEEGADLSVGRPVPFYDWG